MPLEILLCHRMLGAPQEEYAVNFEHLKTVLATLTPEPHYTIKTLQVNPNSLDMGKHSIFNLNPPIVILYDQNNPGYGRLDDLYNYVSLFEKAKYVIIVNVFDPAQKSYLDLKEKLEFWKQAYETHPLADRIGSNLIIDKTIPIDSLNILINQICADFSGINDLSNEQALIVLQSLINLLKRGSLNNVQKPYSITFGGVKDYTGSVTLPSQASTLLSYTGFLFQESKAKQHLLKIVNDIKQLAANSEKPFSRSSSTHHFYQHTIPLFVARSILKENITAKEKIGSLSERSAREILENLYQYLIKDNHGVDRAYQVGFWGGKKFQLADERKTIIVPTHVHQLLNAVKSQDNISHKEKLSNIFDQIMVAADSKCSSRKDFTRNFYSNVLPGYIVKMINEKPAEPALTRPHYA